MSIEPTRVVSLTKPGTAVARYIIAKAVGRGDRYRELLAAEPWRDTPQVFESLKLQEKAAVAAGSTTDATWAGPLALYGIAGEALTIMRDLSILGALAGKMRRIPLHTRVARETGVGVSGGWVAAGAPIPVQATAFATVIEEHYKYAAIAALSEELITLSVPDAMSEITRTVLGGLSAAIDNHLLLPTEALSAGVNGASLLNGSTERVTTGSTSAAIRADLASMMASVTSPGPRVWVLRPNTRDYLTLTLGRQETGLPTSLFGIDVIASINSPAQVALLDPHVMLLSDTGQFDVDVSHEALVQLDTAPDATATAATVYQNLYQRNLFGVRAMRWLAWLNPSPTTTAAFMTVAY